MKRIVFALCVLGLASAAGAQTKWEILDNSFLIEESFNQEARVFQNIFTWTRGGHGQWDASFTQEWPAPNMSHQLSYTVSPDDVFFNYRYQLFTEAGRRPAVSPRFSVIAPSGGIQVNLPASKQFGDFYVHANAGWTWIPGDDTTPHVGGSGIWRVTPMFNVMLEAFAELNDEFTVSPGFRRGWNFGERQLVVGVAMPMTRTSGDTGFAILTYLSYELPFR